MKGLRYCAEVKGIGWLHFSSATRLMHAIFKFGRQHQAVHKTATKALCAPFAEALREGAVSATTLLDPLSPGCLPLAAAGVATCASEKPWTPYPPLRRLEDSWAGVGPIARATDGLFARPKQQQQVSRNDPACCRQRGVAQQA